ncbi:MAG: protoporphyrinogen/coproporphyrinogen oxidase [Nitrospiraceae bacterium]
MNTTTILGAGLSGLGTSFHVGHDKCVIYEAKSHYGGHIYSETRDGFTWDDGPHVSYTDNEYVRSVFEASVKGEFQEYETCVSNYFQGHWIEHPAQSNLYQVPEPLRTECLNSFLEARSQDVTSSKPVNYQEWLYQAFGRVFAETFPAAYTRKYWTTDPINLGVDWIGKRVFYPNVEDVTEGYKAKLGRATYWVTKWRYPSRGGFLSYAKKFAEGARLHYRKTLIKINFSKQQMVFSDGTQIAYDNLVSTVPLPVLIECSEDAPKDVREAASVLRCTNFLLIEVAANHPAKRSEQWIYVYDENKLSTRISIIEHFSPQNAPESMTGLSVEVYGSAYRPLPANHEEVAQRVQRELVEMGLLQDLNAVVSVQVRYVPWGNVIYDHNRRSALDRINAFLDRVGVICVGRFAEWGYLMTHDCVLRSKRVGEQINS